jgi:hypothetical protein
MAVANAKERGTVLALFLALYCTVLYPVPLSLLRSLFLVLPPSLFPSLPTLPLSLLHLSSPSSQTMSLLSAASMESYTRAYPFLTRLHILQEIETGSQLAHTDIQSLPADSIIDPTQSHTQKAAQADVSISTRALSATTDSNVKSKILQDLYWDHRLELMSPSLKERSATLAVRRCILGEIWPGCGQAQYSDVSHHIVRPLFVSYIVFINRSPPLSFPSLTRNGFFYSPPTPPSLLYNSSLLDLLLLLLLLLLHLLLLLLLLSQELLT